MIRDLEQMIAEVDPDFFAKRHKRLVYKFGKGTEAERKFYQRVVPGEPYSWLADQND